SRASSRLLFLDGLFNLVLASLRSSFAYLTFLDESNNFWVACLLYTGPPRVFLLYSLAALEYSAFAFLTFFLAVSTAALALGSSAYRLLPAGVKVPSLFWYLRTPHFMPLMPQ